MSSADTHFPNAAALHSPSSPIFFPTSLVFLVPQFFLSPSQIPVLYHKTRGAKMNHLTFFPSPNYQWQFYCGLFENLGSSTKITTIHRKLGSI